MPLAVRNHPFAALRAVIQLFRDPNDLPKVFTVIESLPGRGHVRALGHMQATEEGRRLLEERPNLSARLIQHGQLLALPVGTLGNTYAQFVLRSGISVEGILAASAAGQTKTAHWPEDLRFVENRMRDSHDLCHVVTGYGTDVGGELALLSFILAQNFHPGVALICGFAYLLRFRPANALMRAAYRRAKKATWLPGVIWEDLLERPLDEVRSLLGVGTPPSYDPITPEELLPWQSKSAA